MHQVTQDKIIRKTTLYIIYGAIVSIFSSLLLSFAFSNVAFADTSVNYNVQIEQALNITVSSDTISLDLNPESKDFGTEDLSVSVGTNYINGYRLYINSSSTNLTNSAVSSTIPTLASATPASSFPANYWGYRISSGSTGDSSITDEDYHEFTSGTLVSSSSTAVDSNTSVLTFAAKANYDKPAGTYANTFTFNAVVNPVTYSITYEDTSGDATVANLPSFSGDPDNHTQTGMITGGTATISSTIPTRTGHTFSGWCDGIVTNNTCSGTTYQPGATIDFSASTTVDVTATLTAMWDVDSYNITIVNTNTTSVPASTISVSYGGSVTVTVAPSTNYYLSSVSCPDGYTCSGYNTGISYTGQQTVTVTNNSTDSDGTLRFTGELAVTYIQDYTKTTCEAEASSSAMTVTDKRDNNEYTVRYIKGNCWMTQNLRFTGTSINSDTTNINTVKTLTYYSLSSGDSSYTDHCDSTNGHDYACIVVGNTTTGAWYNYAAATAMTITGSSNSVDAVYDICPKNWRLPTYDEMLSIVSKDSSEYSVFNPVNGGSYYNGSVSGPGTGYWPSSTAQHERFRYTMGWSTTYGLYAGGSQISRTTGSYVRCVRSS